MYHAVSKDVVPGFWSHKSDGRGRPGHAVLERELGARGGRVRLEYGSSLGRDVAVTLGCVLKDEESASWKGGSRVTSVCFL